LVFLLIDSKLEENLETWRTEIKDKVVYWIEPLPKIGAREPSIIWTLSLTK